MTADVASWLAGALDEIEQVARAAVVRDAPDSYPGDWDVHVGDHLYVNSQHGLPVATVDANDGERDVANHIALHDPRAVLARVEAERGIVEEFLEYRDRLTPDTRVAMEAVIWTLANGHRHDVPGFNAFWPPAAVTAYAR